MVASLPKTFRAVVLRSFSDPQNSLSVAELPIPDLKSGEVLIRMAVAPINPSDLVFLRNQYGIQKPLPVVPGFEGSGMVVATGPGLLARWLLNRRVACKAPEDGHGTWAEYMVTHANACIPLRRQVSFEQGATLIVNPLTAYALMRRVHGTHRAFIQTAAASALGRMMARLADRYRLPGIHVVRRPEQVAGLEGLKHQTALVSSAADFAQQLRAAIAQHQPTLLLDAVGGEMSEKIVAAMPRGSQTLVFGALSGEPCRLSAKDVIFENKSLAGFWLTRELQAMPLLKKLWLGWQVQGLLSSLLSTQIQGRFGLDQFHEALAQYKAHRSDGKVLLTGGAA